MYKQKKLHSPLILFVPGNCDKSGALAGKCPVSDTRCVLVLMVWPQLCSSLVGALPLQALRGLCAAWGECGGVLGGGVDYGGKPQYPSFGWRGEAGLGYSLLEGVCLRGGASGGSCPRSVLIGAPGSEATLGPALVPVLTHISRRSAIPVCYPYSCIPPATACKCFLLLQRWLIWASLEKNIS